MKLKIVSFRLDEATLANLDIIAQLLPNVRQGAWWAPRESRTSALRFAARELADTLTKEDQVKQQKAKPAKPKKKVKVKK